MSDVLRLSRREALNYAQSMIRELNQIMQACDCQMPAYLLEMAYLEVSDILRGERPVAEKNLKEMLNLPKIEVLPIAERKNVA
ncbi:MAG: hypothetical protein ACTHJQ_07105 [Rhizobiaceae bacterium]